MAAERRALLVATDAYSDPGLAKLRAPAGDVRALAEVLSDPEVGGFDTRQLVNRSTEEVKQEIEGFFAEARHQHLLLLYVSGHGVLSPRRRLYFATSTTTLTHLRATAIEDGFLHDVMEDSRARSIVLVLDCCHSGAFDKGLSAKSALGVDVEQRFSGQGRITLTASTALEYAFEETEADASDVGAAAPGSLFTRYLVEGLKTGDADVDQDGDVLIDELYDYVYARVRERSPHQTPGKSGASYGDIVIARNPHRPTVPAEVRKAIDQAIDHPWPSVRETAVTELARLRRAADRALAPAIEEALRRAVDDDSRRVSAAAEAALRSGATSDAAEAAPAPEANTDAAEAAPVPEANTDAAEAAPAPEANTDAAEAAPAPEATTDAAEAAPAPEASTDAAEAAPAPEATTDPAEAAGAPGPLPTRLRPQHEPSHHLPTTAPRPAVPNAFERARELARLTHDGSVRGVAFDADGTRIASASGDNTARVWDSASGRELARLTHDDAVWGVAVSPDGTRIASVSDDNTARVWDSASGRELARLTHDKGVWGVAFSPDGTRIATASGDRTARVWDSSGGRELVRVTHDNAVWGMAFSPEGTRIATASWDNTARVWDSASGRELARLPHDDWVRGVAFSPDGARIATGSNDHIARVWDSASGRELARLPHSDAVRSVAFSHDDRWIATACWDKTARVWDCGSARELARLTHDDEVWDVAFSPDDTRIVTATAASKRITAAEHADRAKLGRSTRISRYGYAILWGAE